MKDLTSYVANVEAHGPAIEAIAASLPSSNHGMFTPAGGRKMRTMFERALGKLQSAESNKEVIGSVQWLLLAYARLVQHDYPSYYEAGDTDVEETVRYFAMDMHKFATQRVDGDSVHVSMAYQDTLRATDAMWMKAQSKAWAESKKRAA